MAEGNISSYNLKEELNNKLTWKLQEFMIIYYIDLIITTSQFTQYCTTIDQQI